LVKKKIVYVLSRYKYWDAYETVQFHYQISERKEGHLMKGGEERKSAEEWGEEGRVKIDTTRW